ncbi:MAG: 4-hydroxyphenylacetate decarboxylase large subunit [Vulcanimicrobiota bacterium]
MSLKTDNTAKDKCSSIDSENYNRFGKLLEQNIVDREIKKKPTPRASALRDMLLDAKSSVCVEFTYWYSRRWDELEGDLTIIRRAEALKCAFEHITPVIYPGELLVMGKAAYLRGSHPFPWLSEAFFMGQGDKAYKEALKAGRLSAGQATKWGSGGGNVTSNSGNVMSIAGKFGIRMEEISILEELADRFSGKSVEDVGHKYEQEVPGYAEKEAIMRSVICMYDSGSAMPQGREVANYYYPLQYGIDGIIDICKKNIAEVAGKPDMDRLYFYKAVVITLEGIKSWILNYAREAEFMASLESEPEQKREYQDIADRLKLISGKRPETFRDAMQLMWLFHIAVVNEDCASGFAPGRIGQVLYPFWKRDMEKGLINEQETIELLECLRIKFTQIDVFATSSLVGGVLSGNTFNNVSLGGLLIDASSAANELESLILEAGMTCETTQPTLTLLYDEKMPEEFLLKAVESIKTGSGYPAIVNNLTAMEFILQNYGPEGMTLEEARSLSMGGCLENAPGCWMPLELDGVIHHIPGGASGCAGVGVNLLNLPKLLELVLFDGVNKKTGERVFPSHGYKLDTYEELWNAFKKYCLRSIEVLVLANNIQYDVWRQKTPSLVNSLLKPDCLVKGRPIGREGSRYNATLHVKIAGNQNLINSIASLKKNVYDDKAYTIDDYRKAIEANFGFKTAEQVGSYSFQDQVKKDEYPQWEKIHKKSLDAPKFGNDDKYVDDIFKEWQEWIAGAAHNFISLYGKPMYIGEVSVSTHAPMGAVTLATPDGRLCGTTLADGSVSAYPGTDKNGPYALFNSASCFDHSRSQSTQLNMKIHPSVVVGRDGSVKFLELIRGYMRTGSFHIQFNIVDSRMLRDAQLHPEKYKGLMVRVAGFTQYWAELGKQIQDEVIARTEYEMF